MKSLMRVRLCLFLILSRQGLHGCHGMLSGSMGMLEVYPTKSIGFKHRQNIDFCFICLLSFKVSVGLLNILLGCLPPKDMSSC